MGEAKRRGTASERKQQAIKRNKQVIRQMCGPNAENDQALITILNVLLSRLSPDEWPVRRQKILESLRAVLQGTDLETAKPIRIREDEIGWYLFLCEQFLHDPMCTDVSQASRALPFMVALGQRWEFATRVRGIELKLDALLHEFKSDPDGIIFELLVALSYAAKGWEVEMLPESPPTKSPDMRVTKGSKTMYVECKRQSRRADYAEKERKDFLRVWDAALDQLIQNRQWLWINAQFHVEASALPTNFLLDIYQKSLPLVVHEKTIYDGAEGIIRARLIDRTKVHRHLQEYQVKTNSPALTHLLGDDWAPMNASITLANLVQTSHVVDCDIPALGMYVNEVAWACGITREFDGEISIDKKARDVKKRLAEAVEQLPTDVPSVIHLAVETLEGADVERRRTAKVMQSIPSFITDKPVLAVRVHLFQTNQSIDQAWVFDETIQMFQVSGANLDDVPLQVAIPHDMEMQSGNHWELYG